jgi:U5 snRNP protein, DIM1 family
MSYLLPHLHSGWEVDKAIVAEEKRVVVIRFGSDSDPTCMRMDDTLAGISEDIKNFASIFLVDTREVPDFNEMYELYDACTVMFFFRNKHIMLDLGTGNNNKIVGLVPSKQVRRARAEKYKQSSASPSLTPHSSSSTGADRYHRSCVPRRQKGPGPCHRARGPQYQVPLLSCLCALALFWVRRLAVFLRLLLAGMRCRAFLKQHA